MESRIATATPLFNSVSRARAWAFALLGGFALSLAAPAAHADGGTLDFTGDSSSSSATPGESLARMANDGSVARSQSNVRTYRIVRGPRPASKSAARMARKSAARMARKKVSVAKANKSAGKKKSRLIAKKSGQAAKAKTQKLSKAKGAQRKGVAQRKRKHPRKRVVQTAQHQKFTQMRGWLVDN